ncbi:SWI/SNF complex component snf12 [Tulasnella sp. 419]|nr:SWI/SNF complex component snf12 [Tulasnella sp. 418]KAG8970152.1 SWI/SNF complex component snf12 [Tulasnella sp. 419]
MNNPNDAAAPKQLKKRKLVDRNLPTDVDEIAEESQFYHELQDMERKLDWTMMRKRMELQEAFGKTIKTRRKLRVFISHTASGQSWQGASFTNGLDFDSGVGIPSWTLRIEGRLLDSPVARLNKGTTRKFSSFLKSMVVEFDRDTSLYPEPNIVEWHRSPNQPPQDGFEIKRRGDISVKCRIILNLEHQPEHYRVDPLLGDIINVKEETRVGVIAALWNYIKSNGLQDKVDRRLIRFDAALANILQVPEIRFQHVPELVNRFLHPLEPIVLHHMIVVEQPTIHTSPASQAFDIDVDMDDLFLKSKISQSLLSFNNESQSLLLQLDDEIAHAVQSVRNSKLKRDFLQAFADNPKEFIDSWIASQSRDLEVILGDDGRGGVRDEDLRRSDFFRLPWVREAVSIYEGMRSGGTLRNPQVR